MLGHGSGIGLFHGQFHPQIELADLEEGVGRDPELQAQQLLVDAAFAGHQLARQVLQVGRRPGEWREDTL